MDIGQGGGLAVGRLALARFAGLLDRVVALQHNDPHGTRAYTFRVRGQIVSGNAVGAAFMRRARVAMASSDYPDNHPTSRRRVYRALCILGGACLALVMGEAAVRILGLEPTFNIVYRRNFRRSANSVLEYELMPGSRDNGSVINRAGMRDREFAVTKPHGVFRIVVIGDSVTFGFACSRGHAYPKQLESLLNEAATPESPRFEVLNLGVTGYNARQIVETLRVRGLRYQPDLVIYGYVLNDPQAFSLEAECLQALTEQAERSFAKDLSVGFSRVASHSKLFVLGRRLLRKPAHRLEGQLEDPGFAALRTGSHEAYLRALHVQESSWRTVRDALAELARVTTTPRRIPVLVAVFPIEWSDDFDPYPLGDVHDLVIAEARARGLQALDLTAAYATGEKLSEERIFCDFLHPTQLGHRVAALALLKWIVKSDLPPAQGIDLDRLSDGSEDEVLRETLLGAGDGS